MTKTLPKAAKMTIVALFLLVLPITAVMFSKWGLDKYRDLRSEMALMKDSIKIPDFQLRTHTNQPFDTSFTKGKMLLVNFAPSLQDAAVQQLLQQVQPIQKTFNKEDRRKYYLITYTCDSAALIKQELIKHQIDTLNWKFLPVSNSELATLQAQYRVPPAGASAIVLVGSKGYLCDIYNTAKKEEMELLKSHMTIVIPKKERKRIEYRQDKDPYQ